MKEDVTIRSRNYRLINYFCRNSVFVLIIALSSLFIPIIFNFSQVWNFYFFASVILLILGFLLALIQSALEYAHIGYSLEGSVIIFQSGMFSVSKITIPYSKISNATLHQSLFARAMSVGDILIDQEDSSYKYNGLDKAACERIISAINKKSNIQPVSKANS